jgi:hypothetical protein
MQKIRERKKLYYQKKKGRSNASSCVTDISDTLFDPVSCPPSPTETDEQSEKESVFTCSETDEQSDCTVEGENELTPVPQMIAKPKFIFSGFQAF